MITRKILVAMEELIDNMDQKNMAIIELDYICG